MRLGTYYRAALMERLGLADVDGCVLDVGGFDGFWLSRLACATRVSVDIEPHATYDGVSYVCGDGSRLPFGNDAFDAIFALDVIEHVDDDQGLASELLRVLRPGGRLIVTTPNEDVHIFPAFLQPWANRRWQHERVSGYRPSKLHDLLAVSNARDIQVEELPTRGFLNLYLPLSVFWRLWRAPARLAVRRLAGVDSTRRRGSNGYLLAQVTK